MAIITVTPDQLRTEAARLGQFIDQHDNNMTNIRNLVNSLSGQWKGAAQDAFYAQFESQQPVFNDFKERLRKFQLLMNDSANRLQETDQGMSATIRNF